MFQLLAITAMAIFRITQPPAGATTLVSYASAHSAAFLAFPILTGAVALVLLSLLILPLALMLRPRHPFVLRWAGLIVPLLFAVLYAIIIAMRIGHAGGDFRSLSGVAALFQDPWFLLAGWVHYLTFDLLS